MKRSSLVAAACLLGASTAHAQWAKDASNAWGYTTDYAWTAAYECRVELFGPNPCATTATGVRLTSGTAWADISFVGTSGTLTANHVPFTTLIGTHTVTFGGVGPFVFQPVPAAQALFAVRYTVLSTTPNVSGGVMRTSYFFQSPTVLVAGCCELDMNAGLLTLPAPAGFATSRVVSFHDVSRTNISVNGPATWTVTASVGIAPEPSTWLMMLAGLGAIGATAYRRRGNS